MTLQGHPTSLILAPIENAYDFLCDLNSNLGPAAFQRAFVRLKPLFSAPNPYSGKNVGVFPLE